LGDPVVRVSYQRRHCNLLESHHGVHPTHDLVPYLFGIVDVMAAYLQIQDSLISSVDPRALEMGEHYSCYSWSLRPRTREVVEVVARRTVLEPLVVYK
jgi:hypothetical protein